MVGLSGTVDALSTAAACGYPTYCILIGHLPKLWGRAQPGVDLSSQPVLRAVANGMPIGFHWIVWTDR